MSILIQKKSAENGVINTGKGQQDLPKATIGYALCKEDHSFATIALAISKSAWDTAKKAKDIVVMFSIANSELANSEATYYEARKVKEKTKKAERRIKFHHHLDMYSDTALASYEDSEYTRIIEFKEDGKFLLVKENGVLKGQKISDFIVGMNEDSTIAGDPSKTTVEIVYDDADAIRKGGHLLIPEFDLENYQGIYNVVFTVVSASSTEVKMTATNYDGKEVDSLLQADFKFLKADLTDQLGAVSGFSYTEGEYVFTGIGFVTGTLNTDGVIQQTNIDFEGEGDVIVTVV